MFEPFSGIFIGKKWIDKKFATKVRRFTVMPTPLGQRIYMNLTVILIYYTFATFKAVLPDKRLQVRAVRINILFGSAA
jgi:hypothetical protein